MFSTFSHKLCISALAVWLFFFIIDLAIGLTFFFTSQNPKIISFLLYIILGVVFFIFIIYYLILFFRLSIFIKKGTYSKGRCQIVGRGDKFPLFFSVSMKVEINKTTLDTNAYFSNVSSGKYLGKFYECLYNDKTVILLKEIH